MSDQEKLSDMMLQTQVNGDVEEFVDRHQEYNTVEGWRAQEKIEQDMRNDILEVKIATTRPANFNYNGSNENSLLRGDKTEVTLIFVSCVQGPHIEYHAEIEQYATHNEIGDVYVHACWGKSSVRRRLVSKEREALQWVAQDWAEGLL